MDIVEVRVSDVKKWAGREEAFRVSEPWPDVAQSRVDYPLTNPAQVDVLVRNTGGGTLVVDISGHVRVEAVCSRCVENFTADLAFAATEEFRDEPGPNDESLDYSRFTGDLIDLDAMVADAVGVSIPIALTCRPDCQGLCPLCGTNRNVDSCRCQFPADDRWAKLAGLVSGDKTEDEELERENHGRSKA